MEIVDRLQDLLGPGVDANGVRFVEVVLRHDLVEVGGRLGDANGRGRPEQSGAWLAIINGNESI